MWLLAWTLACCAAALALLNRRLRRAAAELDGIAGTPTGCTGWPAMRDTVQPDLACQGCARWLSASTQRQDPPQGIVMLRSGMHCPDRVGNR